MMLGPVMSRTSQRHLHTSFKFTRGYVSKRRHTIEPKLFVVMASVTLHMDYRAGSCDSYSCPTPLCTFSPYPYSLPPCPLSISCLLVWALSAKLRPFLVPSGSVPKTVPLSISKGECYSNPTKLQWVIVIFLHCIHQETSPGIYLAASDRYLVAMFFPLTISSK